MKNTICTLFLAFLFLTQALGQKPISDQKSLTGITNLLIECHWANVVVKNWDQPSLKVEGTALVNYGENDDAFVYEIQQEGNQLYFESNIKNMDELPRFVSYTKKGQEYHYKLEKGEDANWREIKNQHNNEELTHMNVGVKMEIDLVFYLPDHIFLKTDLTYGDLSIEDCRNGMDMKNTYGHVIASFPDDHLFSSCSLSSTYSFVDVSISSSAKADLSLQTNYGEIYSDLDFDFDNARSIDKLYKNKIVGVLNNGGQDLILKATYNNIYLRKK